MKRRLACLAAGLLLCILAAYGAAAKADGEGPGGSLTGTLTFLNPTSTPRPTPRPTPGDDDYDVPNVLNFLTGKVVEGEKGRQKADEYNTEHYYYSYDNWSDPFVDPSHYIRSLQNGFYQLKLVGKEEKDYRGQGNGILTLYYFRYTGRKSVTPMRSNERTAKYTYHVLVSYWSRRADDHFWITVRMSPQLVYGKARDPQPSHGTGPNSDPVYTPTPRPSKPPAPVKCTKCHGEGKIQCSQCDGAGGKWIYDNSTRSTGRTWQNCFKCKGSGKTNCTRCGGDGWIER